MPLHCGTEQHCSAHIELVEMIDGHLRLQLGERCRCIAEAYQNDRYVSRFGCHHIDVAVPIMRALDGSPPASAMVPMR
jgi:uncharacterized phosphosugar-binding protein